MSEGETTANSTETAAERLKPFQWKKGQSGNPSGRPKDTLKQYVAMKLNDMTPREKEDFLKGVSKELQWKMAEGNPKQDTDVTSGGEKIEFAVELTGGTDECKTSSETERSDEGQPQV